MQSCQRILNLGYIICQHCNRIIDTVDTDRVIIYYSTCKDSKCKSVQAG